MPIAFSCIPDRFYQLLNCCLPSQDLLQLSSQFRKIEKAELHLHLGGSWPLDYLREIATPNDFAELSHHLGLLKNGVDYHEVFAVFAVTGRIVNTNKKVEDGVKALCQQLIDDGVTHAEMRTGLKDLGSGLEEYLEAVLRGLESGKANSQLKAGLILSVRRDTPLDIAERTIDLALKYREKGVVGIDVSGDSTTGDGSSILGPLLRAKQAGLPIALHIGESPKESAAQQMKELLQLQPQRVGHAVHLCPEARRWVIENKVPVEMCLSSAVKAQMIKDPKDHPALKLLLNEHPVIICTDDPLIFQCSLSEEWAQTAQICGLTVDQLKKLQERTIEHSFLNPGFSRIS